MERTLLLKLLDACDRCEGSGAEPGNDAETVDYYGTCHLIPQAAAAEMDDEIRFHLEMEAERLVREAGASHRLVVRYRGWGGADGRPIPKGPC